MNQNHNPSSIAFFMPAHDEAENLPIVVPQVVEHLMQYDCPFKVIIVNDGSTDDTAEAAEALVNAYPELVQVVHHPHNMGYGAALRTGFKAGLETGYDWIGFFDADNQFRISCLDKLFEAAISNGADIAIGHRVKRADGLKRRVMGRGWHIISRTLIGFSGSDVDCGFKLFSRSALEKIVPKLRGDFATISPEMLALATKGGLTIVETSVEHHPRTNGEQSGASLKVIMGSFKGLWELRAALQGQTI